MDDIVAHQRVGGHPKPSPKIVHCGQGFVGKRANISGQPDYLDRGGEWLQSYGGPPETVATNPFATRETAQAGVAGRMEKDMNLPRPIHYGPASIATISRESFQDNRLQ